MDKQLLHLARMLNIHHKIPGERIQMQYLREVWGMEQSEIAEFIGRSQAYISNQLKKPLDISTQSYEQLVDILWTDEDVKGIMALPREVLTDLQCAAFIIDIMRLDVSHPFFNFYTYSPSLRIAALASLGVRHKCLQQMFGKHQSAISMVVKRGVGKQDFQRTGRYDKTAPFSMKKVQPVEHKEQVTNAHNKFIPAGGQNYIW